jgi:hypothetical protein
LDPEGAAKINIDASRYLAQVVGMNTFFYYWNTINFQKTISVHACCLSFLNLNLGLVNNTFSIA